MRDYPPLPDFDSVDESIWSAIFKWQTATPGPDAYRKANTIESVIINQLRAYVDADRAARSPADSVTAPAGGVVAYLDIGAGGYLDLEAALSDEAMQQLPKGRHALVIAGTYGIAGYVAAPQPSSTAHPDSVQEDALRYRWLREGNDAKHGAAWHVAVNLYGCEWDAAIDAARKQGGAT